MSPIEKRGEATTTAEKGLFDLAEAKQKIALIIELKKRDEDWQLSQELVNPFLSAMVDTLLQWGDVEEKKQAAYVAKLLEWQKEAKRFADEKRRLGIDQALNDDTVKMWSEGLSVPRSSLPEVVRAVIAGDSLQMISGDQLPEKKVDPDLVRILAPELENNLSQLAEESDSTKFLSRENKYGNQSGEHVENRNWLARQAVIDSVLAWAETLRANKDARELSLALEYKPIIVDLKIKIVEASLIKIEDKEEKKRLTNALREVKNYVREFGLLTKKQKDGFFGQVKEQSAEQPGKDVLNRKEKKKKSEKGNPFANLFRRKHGISEEAIESN